MGGAFSTFRELLDEGSPPKSKFSVDQMPDLTGQVMIVTGGNAGIGKETIKALLNKNAKVYMASRSKAKADAANAEIKKETGKEAIFLELDLANLKSIKRSVDEFLSKENQLHVLFNNGGVMAAPVELLTSDGYDLQFGTNVLGHFYFTKLLLPTLIETAKNSPDHQVRVITTSSNAHLFHGLSWDTFRDGPARKKLGRHKLYAQSKFGNVVISNEFARRYGDQKIVFISLNPGPIKTELQRHTTWYERLVINRLLYPAPYGALTQLWAGTMAETAGYNGKYLKPWARLGKARPQTADPEAGQRLWDWCEEQVKGI